MTSIIKYTSHIFQPTTLEWFFLNHAWWVILLLLVTSLIGLLLELRLPLRLYWGLPAHLAQQTLYRLGIKTPPPHWGKCYSQKTNQPLPLVAIQLLNQTGSKVLDTTYSDYQGHYGFSLIPGRYLLRATKNHYQQSSLLNPESVAIRSLEKSFVSEVVVVNTDLAPSLDLQLSPQDHSQSSSQIKRLTSFILLQLGHLSLIAVSIIAILGLWYNRDPLYAIIVCLCLVLLFIKLYILRLIDWVRSDKEVASRSNHSNNQS